MSFQPVHSGLWQRGCDALSLAGVVGRASISARLLQSAICFLLLRALSFVLPSDKSIRFFRIADTVSLMEHALCTYES
ncbi:hypothetical protein KCU61_g782, partial [Aureobasidium melanogenum]